MLVTNTFSAAFHAIDTHTHIYIDIHIALALAGAVAHYLFSPGVWRKASSFGWTGVHVRILQDTLPSGFEGLWCREFRRPTHWSDEGVVFFKDLGMPPRLLMTVCFVEC